MHNQNLGRVAIVDKGEYDPAAHYDRLDAVSYGGSSYLVRKPCQGITPVVGEYYMLMARAGATGQTGAKGDAGDIGPVGPKGDKGDTGNDGADGKDGLSPKVTVSDITGGHRITITDANGAKTVDVMDGEPGADGAPGRNGADGRTPVYGTDYATPAQIKEIAAQAAKVLELDVNELKDDISDVNNTTEKPVAAGKVWTSTANGAGWVDPNGGSGGNGSGDDYELIEKIIVGYSLTTEKPSDWAENYTAYFINSGTPINPVYTAVTGSIAPTWESNKFYAYTDSGVSKISRLKYKNGDNYSLKHVMFYAKCSAQMAYGISCSVKFDQSSNYFKVGVDSKATKYFIEAKNATSHFRILFSSDAPTSIADIATKSYFDRDLNYSLPIIGVDIIANRYQSIPSGSEISIYGVRK